MNHNHNHSRWLVLVAMTSALSMVMLDQTVVTVALPSMARDLSLSHSGQQWVMNAYVLAMAALVALGGKLGDRLGGVTTFQIGVIIFFVASVGCGLAPPGSLGEGWLIAAHSLQGAGAALMLPPSAAIVMAAFPVVERGRAMALYAGIAQLFLAAGALLGGALTQWTSWRTVFWLNVPVGVAALILVQVARPDNTRRSEATIPARPVVLLVVGIGATVLAVQQGSSWSCSSPLTWHLDHRRPGHGVVCQVPAPRRPAPRQPPAVRPPSLPRRRRRPRARPVRSTASDHLDRPLQGASAALSGLLLSQKSRWDSGDFRAGSLDERLGQDQLISTSRAVTMQSRGDVRCDYVSAVRGSAGSRRPAIALVPTCLSLRGLAGSGARLSAASAFVCSGVNVESWPAGERR